VDVKESTDGIAIPNADKEFTFVGVPRPSDIPDSVAALAVEGPGISFEKE